MGNYIINCATVINKNNSVKNFIGSYVGRKGNHKRTSESGESYHAHKIIQAMRITFIKNKAK